MPVGPHHHRQLERHDRAIKHVGDLDRHAGAVAGVGLGPRRAPMVQAAHGRERLGQDRVALTSLHVDHETDTAAVVLEAGVVQGLRGRQIGVTS